MHTCCSRSCELDDAQALSTHRSTVLVQRQFSLPAYTRVTNFCHIFGRGNGGRLICGTAYTRVYTVVITFPSMHADKLHIQILKVQLTMIVIVSSFALA